MAYRMGFLSSSTYDARTRFISNAQFLCLKNRLFRVCHRRTLRDNYLNGKLLTAQPLGGLYHIRGNHLSTCHGAPFAMRNSTTHQ